MSQLEGTDKPDGAIMAAGQGKVIEIHILFALLIGKALIIDPSLSPYIR